MAQRAGSSSFTDRWIYDVFLSFRGEDTRLGFVSHLYESLRQRGIYAFIDDESLRTGEEITPSLFKAIQESRIAIVVFSKNYASSTFCLDELAKILECFTAEGRLVYPVFYYVAPSDVRRQGGSYGEALAQLEKRFEGNKEKVQKWRLALSQAANLKGCHLESGIAKEQEYIRRITCEVSTRINLSLLHVTDYPVGLVSRVQEVTSLLHHGSNREVKMVGICGIGGIGKSTIARAVYNLIANDFEGSCFLSDIREISQKHGLSHLQEILLNELVRVEDLKLRDFRKGISIIAHRLHRKKILLILDDVNKLDQLQALAGRCSWFGSGSRIIITTRDRHLLGSHGIERIYDVKELNDEESLQLLSWKAFKKDNVDCSYMDVINHAILYSCGLPLALEVIGSNLYGKRVDEWSSALEKYKRIPDKNVLEVLKLSYDALDEEEKEIFLDLACFFKGEKLGDVINMLLSLHEIQAEYIIGVLIDKSLIKIKEDRVTMHDLIRDMGKEIVRQQSPKEPGKRNRLWFYEDILHVLRENTGTNKIEVMILDLPEDKEILWSGEAFMEMTNLKMLVIKNARSSIGPKYLPNSLRVLEWKGYPFEFLPSNFHPTKLVHLDLSNSCCVLLQPFNKKFESLSCMNFKNCKFLRQIPDLSGVSNLTKLWLDDCTNLIEIHDSVGFLDELRELSAMRCINLRTLPPGIKLTSLEHLNLFGCSSLQSFPEILDKMEKMTTLDLDRTAIGELPFSICNLIGLEILDMEECHHLKQLPASICMLPNLWSLRANFCEGMKYIKVCQGGEQASSDCSAVSLKLTYFYFSNCNLSDDSLASCLSYFPNMIHLDLSFNKFTTLPACIKECHHLRYLLLDNCKQLQHIESMPPNLEKFSAICCTSLTKSSRTRVLKQAFYQQPGKMNFILPEKKIPEWLDKYTRGSFVSFWVRKKFPTIFLWILVKDYQDSLCNYIFSVHINDTRLCISSGWLSLSTIKTDHIYICDLQSIVREIELPQVDKWNHIKVSIENNTQEMKSEREIYFAIHVYKQENNVDNIRFENPKTFTDYYLWQKIQQQPQDWEELEDDMIWDSNSTKSMLAIGNNNNNPSHNDIAIMAQGARSSFVTYGWTYDVFLCFRGEDTRLDFIDDLYGSLLQREIRPFTDNESLKIGEDIAPSLFKAIQESRMAIIVFSKNFASSTFCLDELAKILECFKAGRLVYPIFYDVHPLDVRHQRGSYGEAFARHEKRFKNNTEKVLKWRLALSKVANSLGRHLILGSSNATRYIRMICDEVYSHLATENNKEYGSCKKDTDISIVMPQNSDSSDVLRSMDIDTNKRYDADTDSMMLRSLSTSGDDTDTNTMIMQNLESSAKGLYPNNKSANGKDTGYGARVSPVSLDGIGASEKAGGQYRMEMGVLRGRKRILDDPMEKVVEGRKRRKIKNRESAPRCRAKKQAYTVELEAELNQLRKENTKLKHSVAVLRGRRKRKRFYG